MTRLRAFAVLTILVLMASACSAGPGSLPALPGGTSLPLVAPAATAHHLAAGDGHELRHHGHGSVRFTLRLPRRHRRGHYISPNTQSMTISVNGASPIAVGLTPSANPKCTGNGTTTAITCTVAFAAPGGMDTFAFNLYQEALSGGALPPGAKSLATYSTPTATKITVGTVNDIGPFTLGGVPGSISLSPSSFSAPADGQIHTFTLNVTVKDASGATIIPPGDYTAPVSLAVTGDPNNAVQLSATTLTAPPGSGTSSPVTVTYDASKTLTNATVTASATGATPGTANVNPLEYALTGVNAISQLVVGGLNRTLTVSEANFSGTFQIGGAGSAVTTSCNPVGCAPATAGGQVQVTISPVNTGTPTLTVGDGNGATAQIPLSVIATQVVGYTGSELDFHVPSGVTEMSIVASGAQGGLGGGNGGTTSANLPVTAGETLALFVGSAGGDITGGYNGGGAGGMGDPSPTDDGGGGGGASDVREGGNALANRILVAGGGGGAGTNGSGGSSSAGGGATGASGYTSNSGCIATGGSQIAGGSDSAGTCIAEDGGMGGLGVGGIGVEALGPPTSGGGGGGGGYYGGGAGDTEEFSGGGGGGSSYVESTATQTSLQQGTNSSANGSISLAW